MHDETGKESLQLPDQQLSLLHNDKTGSVPQNFQLDISEKTFAKGHRARTRIYDGWIDESSLCRTL